MVCNELHDEGTDLEICASKASKWLIDPYNLQTGIRRSSLADDLLIGQWFVMKRMTKAQIWKSAPAKGQQSCLVKDFDYLFVILNEMKNLYIKKEILR